MNSDYEEMKAELEKINDKLDALKEKIDIIIASQSFEDSRLQMYGVRY
jgi:hypothetical protein